MLHLFSEVLSLLLAFNNAFHRVSLVFFGAWYQHNLFFPSFSFSFKPFFFHVSGALRGRRVCFQPVHHSLRLVPAKCFTPEEQGMFVFFHVTNAAAPSERTARDFFFSLHAKFPCPSPSLYMLLHILNSHFQIQMTKIHSRY